MQNTKLINRLRHFSTEEMSDFVLFAESPYFNKNKALISLLKHLQKYHPELTGSKLKKELIFKKIYPDKQIYKEKRINDLMTNLFQLSEDFLIFDRFKKDPLARSRQELLTYRDHRLYTDFKKTVAKTEKILEEKRKDEEYHLEMFLLNKEVFYHPETARQKVGEQSFPNLIHHLDMFFVWEKIKNSSLAMNREKIRSEKHENKFLNSIVEEYNEEITSNQVLNFFYQIIELLNTENEDLLIRLNKEFKEVLTLLSLTEKQVYLIILLNTFARKNREGKTKFLPNIFSMYKLGIEENLLLNDNNKISHVTFSNICHAASKTKHFLWLENFIMNFQNKIYPLKNQKNAVNIVKARQAFDKFRTSKEEKSLDEVMNYINALQFTEISYIYRAKSLQMQLFFEGFIRDLEHYDFLIDFCRAFEIQLMRSKEISNEKKLLYIRFIRKTKVLAKIIMDKKKEKIPIFIKRLEKTSKVFEKKWLLEKAGEVI